MWSECFEKLIGEDKGICFRIICEFLPWRSILLGQAQQYKTYFNATAVIEERVSKSKCIQEKKNKRAFLRNFQAQGSPLIVKAMMRPEKWWRQYKESGEILPELVRDKWSPRIPAVLRRSSSSSPSSSPTSSSSPSCVVKSFPGLDHGQMIPENSGCSEETRRSIQKFRLFSGSPRFESVYRNWTERWIRKGILIIIRLTNQ